MRRWSLLWLPVVAACSPLASSPFDDSYELEVTLHEVQTNLDDLRHDVGCFQTELHILDTRIKQTERITGAVKLQDLERQLALVEQLSQQVRSLEKRLAAAEKAKENSQEELRQLTAHANETTLALVQIKKRLEGVDGAESHALVYTVKSGDSLEKIARAHKTTVEKIKKYNQFDQDLIVVGQILKIPKDE